MTGITGSRLPRRVHLNGFRNRDLQRVFLARRRTGEREQQRHSAWVSRQLRLLRATA
jgi:hypothetical protein